MKVSNRRVVSYRKERISISIFFCRRANDFTKKASKVFVLDLIRKKRLVTKERAVLEEGQF